MTLAETTAAAARAAGGEPSRPSGRSAARWPADWRSALPIVIAAGLFMIELGQAIQGLMIAATVPDQYTASNRLIGIAQWFLHIPLFLIPALLWRGRVALLDALIAAVVAGWANAVGLFDIWLDRFLHENGLYPWFLLPEAPKRIIPQYAKLMLYAGLAAALLGTTAWRALGRRLWLDHALVTMITAVVLATTLLYHWTVPDTLLMDVRAERLRVLEAVSRLPPSARDAACLDLDLQCLDLALDRPVSGVTPALIVETLESVRRHARAHDALVSHGWTSTASLVDPSLRGFQVQFLERPDGTASLVIDRLGYRHAVDRHQAVFAVLTISAHATWIIGGVGLILFHRWRFAARAARRRSGT